MNPTDKKLVKAIRSSQFEKLSEVFLFSNRIAYVNLRLFQEYFNKSGKNKEFEEWAEDALIDASAYLDKSIRALQTIRSDASRILPAIKTASLSATETKGQIMKGVEAYVRIEKDWEKLFEIADALERTGSLEGEDQWNAKQDIQRLLKDIMESCDRAIGIFRDTKDKILTELGA